MKRSVELNERIIQSVTLHILFIVKVVKFPGSHTTTQSKNWPSCTPYWARDWAKKKTYAPWQEIVGYLNFYPIEATKYSHPVWNLHNNLPRHDILGIGNNQGKEVNQSERIKMHRQNTYPHALFILSIEFCKKSQERHKNSYPDKLVWFLSFLIQSIRSSLQKRIV